MKSILISEPNTPYLEKLHGSIKDGTIFRFKFKLLEKGAHFNINLKSGSNPTYDNIPLHLSFRPGLAPDYIRNTATNSIWGTDEYSTGMPLHINVVYEVAIICQKESFKIMIEGINYAEYKYRLLIETIDHIYVTGAGTISSIMEVYDRKDVEFYKYEPKEKHSVDVDIVTQKSSICNELFVRMPKQIIFNYENFADYNALNNKNDNK